jgi:predicted ABC-type transport system involved in lysophospholipase L1 biosynthesis ATPase subunit
MTLVLVTHDLALARRSDRMVHLHSGAIVDDRGALPRQDGRP